MAAPPSPPAPRQGSDAWRELRRLLLGEEPQRLRALERRLEDPGLRTEDVADVLPEAIAQRTARDERLTQALAPTVEASLDLSIRRDPRRIAEAIFPIIGPAIRRAVAHALRGLMQTLNQVAEHSLSPRGLAWRWEAFRTGIPFAQVVLRHTLVYRVEQVFLIHRRTGLLLEHVVSPDSAIRDPDLVSGMLTAIQDFVRDSFRTDPEDALDSVQVGELTVLVAQGPAAILAAVVRGEPPMALRAALQDTLDTIHVVARGALADFTGDAAPFALTRPYLADSLRAQVAEPARRSSATIWVVAALLLAALAAVVVPRVIESRRWSRYVAALDAEPGIVVVEADRGWRRDRLRGLRDPDAADPVALAEAQGVDPARIVAEWEAYQALDPRLVLSRAQRLLAPPPGVTLAMAGSRLAASGVAPAGWIARAGAAAPGLPGITGLDTTRLVAAETLARFAAARSRVETMEIPFGSGGTDLSPAALAAVGSAAEEIDRLVTLLAGAGGSGLRVTVVGEADSAGSEATNRPIREARARRVRDALVAAGVPAALVETEVETAAGAQDPGRRRATLRITAEGVPTTPAAPAPGP